MEELEIRIWEDRNKNDWINTANWVIENQKTDELIDLFLSKDEKTSQRASYTFMNLVDIDKAIFYPYEEILVSALQQNPTTTQKRNILRLFQNLYIKEEIEAELLDSSLKVLEDPSETVAVRVYAMTVSFRLAEKYREILPELIQLIELNIEVAPTPGLVNRGRKILKKARLLQKERP